MFRVSFALASLLAIAGTASAADMYGAPPPAPYVPYTPAPTANWSGAYVGVQGGYAWGSSRDSFTGGTSVKTSPNGGLIGVYGGYNANIGQNVVVGVEGDINSSGQKATTVNVPGATTYTYKSGWNASLRARAGVAIDRVMPNATAGIAFAENKISGNGASSSPTKAGWALGAGVEGMVTSNILVRGEYQHQGFGSSNHTLGAQAASTNLSNDLLKLGAAYKF